MWLLWNAERSSLGQKLKEFSDLILRVLWGWGALGSAKGSMQGRSMQPSYTSGGLAVPSKSSEL